MCGWLPRSKKIRTANGIVSGVIEFDAPICLKIGGLLLPE